MAAESLSTPGSEAPAMNASSKLPVPAARPLTQAIHDASASATLRVKLLSSAQKRQASSTTSAGHNSSHNEAAVCGPDDAWGPGQLSNSAPTTIAAMPMAMRQSTFSLNRLQAKSAVNTASALSSKAA